ncbi:hcp beta-lactamase [Thraustotheca clavata]|uniref:Hcp beta-lactamase n=1 Tax=Thraustotheca clavata TaxID=74557 RepID=A0A1W0A6X0_9STRA|nr:hcp beta-lactamase [Thraustotheca clavata]
MTDARPSEVARLNEELEKRHYEFVSNCDDGNGDPSACHSYGEWLAVIDKQYDQAAKVYKKNCDVKQYGASCFNYGRLVLAGKGVEASDQVAVEHFSALKDAKECENVEKACELNHTHGCHHLGLMYLSGMGIEKNLEKGMAAIEKACNDGEGSSCYRLGGMYLTSQSKYGMKRDVIKAKAYLEQACDANFAPACHNLAVMYKKGDAGVPKNDKLYEEYSEKTKFLVQQAGGMAGFKTA